jgi:hypothetical protein
MGSVRGQSLCTSCGAEERQQLGQCSACGSTELADMAWGGIVSVPAGALACQRCEARDRPLVFRGTIRHVGAIVISRETRVSGYFCARCARRETIKSLTYTGLLGWWGFISFFLWAPRATITNWRSVWNPPARPLNWGALEATAYAEDLAGSRARPCWPDLDPGPTTS